MTFKEWCQTVFGIVEFSEGYSTNIFLPALPNAILTLTDDLKSVKAYITNPHLVPNLNGIVIPSQGFNAIRQVYENYNIDNLTETEPYEIWLQNMCTQAGVDILKKVEQKELNNIHIVFATELHESHFLGVFQPYFVESGFNVLLQKKTLQFPANFISYLLALYYQSPFAAVKKTATSIALLESQSESLTFLRTMVLQDNVKRSINIAKILAEELYNTPTESTEESPITIVQAVEAYSISLSIYAELYGDNLSAEEYSALHYALRQLRNVAADGQMLPGLLSDCKFLDYLINNLYLPKARSETEDDNLTLNLLGNTGKVIMIYIDNNTNDCLHGGLGEAVHVANTPRFFPDAQMHSETNELVFRAGGMRNNFSIFRIIKVGHLEDGSVAPPTQPPAYCAYYKIEHNLAKGAHAINSENNTCQGTVLRKLIPYDQDLLPLNLDPQQQSHDYQKAMESTISRLIQAERQLLFYKESVFPWEDFVGPELLNAEDVEWGRLNKIKNVLSGAEYIEPVTYFSPDSITNDWTPRIITNQHHFFEEGRTGSLLSLQAFVASMLGRSLATRHINFMQLYNADAVLQALEEKLDFLKNLLQVSTPLSSPLSSAGASKNPSPVPTEPPAPPFGRHYNAGIGSQATFFFPPAPHLGRLYFVNPSFCSQSMFFVPTAKKYDEAQSDPVQNNSNALNMFALTKLRSSTLIGAKGIRTVYVITIDDVPAIDIHCYRSSMAKTLINSINKLAPKASQLKFVEGNVHVTLKMQEFETLCRILNISYKEILDSMPKKPLKPERFVHTSSAPKPGIIWV